MQLVMIKGFPSIEDNITWPRYDE